MGNRNLTLTLDDHLLSIVLQERSWLLMPWKDLLSGGPLVPWMKWGTNVETGSTEFLSSSVLEEVQ